MTLPRRLKPGQLHTVTRRTARRTALLRPSRRVNQIHCRRLLEERLEQIHAQRQAEGRTRVAGAAAVQAQDPLDALVADTFPTFALNPRLAG